MPFKSKQHKEFTFAFLKNDIPAGLVVFLVALPLCLGIALASGAPLFSGIITGMVGGIIVGALSGSQLSVSGPAAGLTAIVFTAIPKLGSFEVFLLAVVLAGVIQLILGFLKAGIIGHYFPSSVIKGMLAAIGLILILKQIPHALGYDKDNEGDFDFLQVDGENTFTEIFTSLNFLHPGAIIIAVISLFILILWERPMLKKYAFFKLVPGALIAVLAGVAINEWVYTSVAPDFILAGDKLVRLPVAHTANEFIGQFTLPDFTAFGNGQVYVTAITLALIASVETLLSLEATDKLDPWKRNSPTNRELKAQGVGNIISGLIGGLPMTAVIVRSSANINSGGKTKMSAIIHGLLLFGSVAGLATILNRIPLACLAAVLLLVGYKLAKVSLFKSMIKLGLFQFLPFIVTIVSILLTDLLVGIGIGMGLSVLFILRNNYKRTYMFDPEKHKDGEPIVIKLHEDVTFINKGSISQLLSHLPEDAHVIIDGSNSVDIDIDVLEIIHDFKTNAMYRNIKLELRNVPEFRGVAGH